MTENHFFKSDEEFINLEKISADLRKEILHLMVHFFDKYEKLGDRNKWFTSSHVSLLTSIELCDKCFGDEELTKKFLNDTIDKFFKGKTK